MHDHIVISLLMPYWALGYVSKLFAIVHHATPCRKVFETNETVVDVLLVIYVFFVYNSDVDRLH